MNQYSKDFPDNLKSKFSETIQKKHRMTGKVYKTPLTSGVSQETPDFFKIKNGLVLTNDFRYKLHNEAFMPANTINRRSSLVPFEQATDGIKDSRPRTQMRNRSADFYSTPAGLPTGVTKHIGEFVPVVPRVVRSFSTDKDDLQRIIENLKKLVKSKPSKLSEPAPRPTVFKKRKTIKKETHDPIQYINPPELSYRENRFIYSLNHV
jgi:hypothetical protein